MGDDQPEFLQETKEEDNSAIEIIETTPNNEIFCQMTTDLLALPFLFEKTRDFYRVVT